MGQSSHSVVCRKTLEWGSQGLTEVVNWSGGWPGSLSEARARELMMGMKIPPARAVVDGIAGAIKASAALRPYESPSVLLPKAFTKMVATLSPSPVFWKPCNQNSNVSEQISKVKPQEVGMTAIVSSESCLGSCECVWWVWKVVNSTYRSKEEWDYDEPDDVVCERSEGLLKCQGLCENGKCDWQKTPGSSRQWLQH